MKIFTPAEIAGMGEKAVREAYAGLRSVANKRIGRMAAQGLGPKKGMQTFAKTRGMNETEVRTALADVSRWIREPSHTVRGYKRNRDSLLDTFHQQGMDYVDENNFEDFIQYMDELREEYGSKVFDSGDAADVYNNAQRIGIPTETVKKNFNYFAEHLDEMDRMRPVRSAKGATMSAIKNKIRNLEG
ncbi:MAG: hypothetical protein IIZ78_12265 [Clostridiales bacterium]|nr:hypothetical protein [Clostridiales bacterium]